ncbi:hypothetical protein [Peptostreptococcus equinus]|uniref:Uncharacterized protein n=1 Tax=Peptostreptococcus equinus TaxID=3003601 RepID=A0ABY7JML4_9FIRM|nr:hypothetical protein [Peptostreptococcus sp. CBA3647]WAW14608.1 hypothetical protein O0R46_08395 [Peptostreptococcus sp. CBA3647]WAW15301.1 hypothetical protein O0R46_02280 [Peptostreptococcus sp. CBA3647]
MNKIEIWDKERDLKEISKEIWLENYPEAKEKTLVLINDSLIVWLEDLKADGFSGETDTAVVETYLKKQAEIIAEYEKKEQARKQLEKEELEKKIVAQATRIDTLSSALEELTITVAGG